MNVSKSFKSHFSKGLTHPFGQKMPNFSSFRLVKIRLEIMFNNFVGKKETFFDKKNLF